jgi:hypothetical protein
MTNNSKLTEFNLRQFTGSENWHRHGINRNVLFTDGAKFVADEGGAYWLLDAIAIAQLYEKSVATEEFQVWNLTVREDRTATLVLRRRQRQHRLHAQHRIHRPAR